MKTNCASIIYFWVTYINLNSALLHFYSYGLRFARLLCEKLVAEIFSLRIYLKEKKEAQCNLTGLIVSCTNSKKMTYVVRLKTTKYLSANLRTVSPFLNESIIFILSLSVNTLKSLDNFKHIRDTTHRD